MSVRYLSHSPADTCAYGERLGRALQGGEILLLLGDLGVGKTQFAKGIALGLGVSAEIVSPNASKFLWTTVTTLSHTHSQAERYGAGAG